MKRLMCAVAARRVQRIQQTKSPTYYYCYCSLVHLLNSNEYMGWKLNLESATYPINHRYSEYFASMPTLCILWFSWGSKCCRNRNNVNCNRSNANARRNSIKPLSWPIPSREHGIGNIVRSMWTSQSVAVWPDSSLYAKVEVSTARSTHSSMSWVVCLHCQK